MIDVRAAHALAVQLRASALITETITAATAHPEQYATLNVPVGAALRVLVDQAAPFYWASATLAACAEGARVLPHTAPIIPPEGAPVSTGFWWLERPIVLACSAGDEPQAWHHYITALVYHIGAVPTPAANPRDGRPRAIAGGLGAWYGSTDTPARGGRIPDDATWNLLVTALEPGATIGGTGQYVYWGTQDDEALDVASVAAQFVALGLRFLATEAAVTAHAPDRAERRRAARERRTPPPVVRVVELRRRPDAPAPGDGHTPALVDWQHRWTVRGHWHKYHTKDGLQPRFVHAYVKGPADRPLKEPQTVVYHVKR